MTQGDHALSIASYHIPFIHQGLRVLETLDDDLYRAPGAGGRACVGVHFRHVIDYYRSFLRGVESGRIDYDDRRRDSRLETGVTAAWQAMSEVADRLDRLAMGGERPVDVQVDAAAHGGGAVWSRSSVARELHFLLSHTVHHYALIAMTLRSAGVELEEELGVAPSTLAFQRSGDVVEAR